MNDCPKPIVSIGKRKYEEIQRRVAYLKSLPKRTKEQEAKLLQNEETLKIVRVKEDDR